jgi:MerR family transcriptional regulator, copper efflux regulator
MRIGELAEQAGISTKAIRYYEQVGILTPPARTPSGYRSYDDTALGRLSFVRAAQAVGLTLGEIRQVIAFRGSHSSRPVASRSAGGHHLARRTRVRSRLNLARSYSWRHPSGDPAAGRCRTGHARRAGNQRLLA